MTRQELKEQHRQWRAAIAHRIETTTDTYMSIAIEMGCSLPTIQTIATEFGVRRKADKATEVSNG